MLTLDQLLYGKSNPKTMPSKTKEYILYGKKVDLTREAYQYYVDKKVPIREAQFYDFTIPRYRDQKPYGTVTTTPTTPANSGGNAPANTTFEKLYPKQTAQLIKMGVDMTQLGEHQTELGKIVTRQDQEDIILHEKHLDQETRISANADAIATHGHNYAGIDHTHANGATKGSCQWWDIQCQFSKGMEGLGKLALLGVIAFFAFMLIKMRLKI